MTSDNKTMYIRHERTSDTNIRTIFRKGLILLALWGKSYYHRVKYIIFKRSSSKYNEVSHYYLYVIRELPAYRKTPVDQSSSSGWHYINTAGSNQKRIGSRASAWDHDLRLRTDSRSEGSWLRVVHVRVGNDVIDSIV